jgi:hypothetical protein
MASEKQYSCHRWLARMFPNHFSPLLTTSRACSAGPFRSLRANLPEDAAVPPLVDRPVAASNQCTRFSIGPGNSKIPKFLKFFSRVWRLIYYGREAPPANPALQVVIGFKNKHACSAQHVTTRLDRTPIDEHRMSSNRRQAAGRQGMTNT